MVPLRWHTTAFLFLGLLLLSSLRGVERVAAQTQGPPTYLVTDLGTVGAGTSSVGYAINAQGRVAGAASTSEPSAQFKTQGAVVSTSAVPAPPGEGLSLLDLSSLNFTSRYAAGSTLRYNFAFSINSRGQTVGYGAPDSDQEEGLGFIADADGTNLRALAAPGDRRSSFARAINERGQVTGTAELRTFSRQAFISGPDGAGPLRNIDPDFPDIDRFSTGRAINAQGRVAGYMGSATYGYYHAFLSGPDGAAPLKDLGTFGGYRSYAYAVNDAGQVAGTANVSASTLVSHAFLSAPDGGALQDLGLPGDGSTAYGANNWAEVVGNFYVGGNTNHAFYYRAEAGGAYDLNTLIDPASGWVLNIAYAINEAGQITGAGTIGGQSHAFVLTPAPPAITSAANVNGQVGQPFTYQIAASNLPTGYGASSLPAGLNVNATTGLISGTPISNGISAVTLNATNVGGTGSATLVLTITAAPVPPPAVTSAGLASGQVGLGFSYQIAATNSPTGFNAMGLPTGLGVNAGNGLISGVPTAAGVYPVTLSAVNASGTGSAVLTLTVAPLPLQPPAIVSPTVATGTVGQTFVYQVAATNAPTRFAAAGLPPGLSLDAVTGAIRGTPAAEGSFPVVLSAANAGGTGSATLTLKVEPSRALPLVAVVGTPARGGFVVSRVDGRLDLEVTVAFHNGGSAVRGVDYEAFAGTVTLPAGQTEALIPVRLFGGANRQKKVKVFLDPAPDGEYEIGKAQSKVFLSDLP